MPLINVVHGERLPDAPFNIRVPYWRVPTWAMALFWLLRGLTRLIVLAVRYWWLSAPTAVLVAVYAWRGWPALAPLVAAVAAVNLGWRRIHPGSWRRWVRFPLLGRWRRLWTYRRGWAAAMATTGLSIIHGGDRYLPRIVAVHSGPWCDRVTVVMLPGQAPQDWGRAAPRLAHTFRAMSGRAVTLARPDRVQLVFYRADPLATVVGPLPVPAAPDLAALPIGRTEDGEVYRLRLTGTHVLVAGATGAGKSSLFWALLAALAAWVRAGLIQIWALDPKGGMELAPGAGLFTRFEYHDADAMAGLLEDAVKLMRNRADRLRGHTRQHQPTPADPVIVVLVDEVAALTAYQADRKLRDRIKDAMSLLLSQGRAVGVHVIAAVQDPRKEVLSFRDLFPTRIALRLTEPDQVDLVLGDGARDRGAHCDRVPTPQPGVGYAVLDGLPEPVRIRIAHLTDADIDSLAVTYAPGGSA